ncbi:MAG: hypothetical protein HUU01_05005 [Saprospiraceae bacterium]|nr:hypothetical protein [Saprospiraceae bacterium]
MQENLTNHEASSTGNQRLAARSIQFERIYFIKNGNKVTKKNWHKVIAKSSRPCTNIKGVPAIDDEIQRNGAYYERWELKYEEATEHHAAGYIFREVNHGGGISGTHPTYREAIWHALNFHVTVWLEE